MDELTISLCNLELILPEDLESGYIIQSSFLKKKTFFTWNLASLLKSSGMQLANYQQIS